MSDTTSEILTRARARLVRGFCQHALAKDRIGRNMEGDNPDAVRWCSIGAIQAELGVNRFRVSGHRAILALGKTLIPDLDDHGTPAYDAWNAIATYNNTHTKEEVLNLFSKTIMRLSSTPDPAVMKLVNKLKEAIQQEEVTA